MASTIGELAVEMGVVSFDDFISEARARKIDARSWLKAKQRGELNTFKQGYTVEVVNGQTIVTGGTLMVAPPGQTPAEHAAFWPERGQ